MVKRDSVRSRAGTPAFIKLNCLSVGLSTSHARKHPSNPTQVHRLALEEGGRAHKTDIGNC
jgi:hypothetical protein